MKVNTGLFKHKCDTVLCRIGGWTLFRCTGAYKGIGYEHACSSRQGASILISHTSNCCELCKEPVNKQIKALGILYNGDI